MENTSQLTTEKVFDHTPTLEDMCCQHCIYSRPHTNYIQNNGEPSVGYVCLCNSPVLHSPRPEDEHFMGTRGYCGQGKWAQSKKWDDCGYIRLWGYDALWEQHTETKLEEIMKDEMVKAR